MNRLSSALSPADVVLWALDLLYRIELPTLAEREAGPRAGALGPEGGGEGVKIPVKAAPRKRPFLVNHISCLHTQWNP